jgi:hypothetical protein
VADSVAQMGFRSMKLTRPSFVSETNPPWLGPATEADRAGVAHRGEGLGRQRGRGATESARRVSEVTCVDGELAGLAAPPPCFGQASSSAATTGRRKLLQGT